MISLFPYMTHITHTMINNGYIMINKYGSVYDPSGSINGKLAHTLMKLLDMPQPKFQYNHKTENKVATVNFWPLRRKNFDSFR